MKLNEFLAQYKDIITNKSKNIEDLVSEIEENLGDLRVEYTIDSSNSSTSAKRNILLKVYDYLTCIQRQCDILSLRGKDYWQAYDNEILKEKTYVDDFNAGTSKLSKIFENQDNEYIDDPYLDDNGDIIYFF